METKPQTKATAQYDEYSYRNLDQVLWKTEEKINRWWKLEGVSDICQVLGIKAARHCSAPAEIKFVWGEVKGECLHPGIWYFVWVMLRASWVREHTGFTVNLAGFNSEAWLPASKGVSLPGPWVGKTGSHT